MKVLPKFYVYALIDPRNGDTIYVGKGKVRRMYKHWRKHVLRNETKPGSNKLGDKLRKIASEGYTDVLYEKLWEGDDEQMAFWFEISAIAIIGRDKLCNATNGGDGISGLIFSDDSRLKMSESRMGKKHSAEARQRMSAAHARRKLKTFFKIFSFEDRSTWPQFDGAKLGISHRT